MSAITIVFPDNAAGAHSAVVVTQLVEKLGGQVVPVGPDEAKSMASPTGPAASLGTAGMLGLRPPGLRMAEPHGAPPAGPPMGR